MNSAARQAALDRIRAGDPREIGELLNSFRAYLAVIVRARRTERLRAKMSESDLIQDSLLAAHRSFGDFRGTTVEELAGWLRQIALSTTSHALRDHDAAKRDVGREQPLAGMTDAVPARDSSTPSKKAMRYERSAQLAAALARLPADMQTVLLGRHVDNVSYADLAARLDRSEGAVRVLYTRALRRLRDECTGISGTQIVTQQ